MYLFIWMENVLPVAALLSTTAAHKHFISKVKWINPPAVLKAVRAGTGGRTFSMTDDQ
jgi:hypothetical protein